MMLLAANLPASMYRDLPVTLQLADIPYDQVILEFDRWIHISFVEDGGTPRKQALIINGEGAMIYQKPR